MTVRRHGRRARHGASDPVEVEGIARARGGPRRRARRSSSCSIAHGRSMATTARCSTATAIAGRVVVANKCDLPAAWDARRRSRCGCQSSRPRRPERDRPAACGARRGCCGRAARDVPAITNVRHVDLLHERARGARTRRSGRRRGNAGRVRARRSQRGTTAARRGDGRAHVGRRAARDLREVLHRQVAQ